MPAPVRKFLIALLIVLISTFSFNAERVRDPDLSKRFFEKGIGSLKVLNYRDALLFFSKAYSLAPKSYYGELSYLYIGKTYSLYSYAFGSKRGVMAAIGYLNQYPFYYKVPRLVHTQREFVADAYLLLQWYDTAKNIYANLYGETEREEYMIKYGYAASLGGSIEGFRYLESLSEVPSDYLDLYYTTMGFYSFNLGRYERAVNLLTRAVNTNPYLREDAHLLFRLGVSYYRLGNWRKALLYLELTLREDPFKVYENSVSFYLANINLETKNFREAMRNIERLIEDGKLFYLKVSQILFSSLWLYDDFLKVYGDRLGNYRESLLKLGWLNVEDVYGELPALGLYYLSLRERGLRDEEREFLRVKRLTLGEFVFLNDLLGFDRYVRRCREALAEVDPYTEEGALLLAELYRTNRRNFLRVFGDQVSLQKLARAMVFLGDEGANDIVVLLRDRSLSDFLMAKLRILEGDRNGAVSLLDRSLSGLTGEDRLEAEVLLGYLKEDASLLEDVLPKLEGRGRLSSYRPLVLLKLADLNYSAGNLKKAALYYREALESGVEGRQRWWAMFRLALLSEKLGDQETLKWVVERTKGEDNIWSRAIMVLWGS